MPPECTNLVGTDLASVPEDISETDTDRLGDALTERSVEIFLDAGLLILISDRFIALSST
jgi:hypothetical protein